MTTYTKSLKKPEILMDLTLEGDLFRLSERTRTWNGYDYLSLIKDMTSVSTSLDIFSLEAFTGQVTVLINNFKPCFGKNRFSHLYADYTFAYGTAVIYWLSEDDPNEVEVFNGVVDSLYNIGYETCQLKLTEFGSSMDNKYIYTVATADKYPGITPEDDGKVENCIYGRVSKAPTLKVDCGSSTSLMEDLSLATPTSFGMSDGSRFPVGTFTIQIDGEHIRVVRVAGSNSLTVVERGYNDTTVTTHDAGAVIIEVQSAYIYLLADHVCTTVHNVYVNDIRVDSSEYIVYYGNYTGYSGKTVIVFLNYPTFTKTIDIDVEDDIMFSDKENPTDEEKSEYFSVDTGLHSHGSDLMESYEAICITDCNYCQIADLIKPIYSNIAYSIQGGSPTFIRFVLSWEVPVQWSPWEYRVSLSGASPYISYSSDIYGNPMSGSVGPNSGNPLYSDSHNFTSSWFAITGYTWSQVIQAKIGFVPSSLGSYPDGYALLRHVVYQIRYIPEEAEAEGVKAYITDDGDGIIRKTGGISVTATTVAETSAAGNVTADVTGYNVTRPDLVRNHMLQNRFDLPSSRIDSDSYDEAGGEYQSRGYSFGILLNDKYTFKDIKNLFSLQTRSILYWENGKEHIKYIGG